MLRILKISTSTSFKSWNKILLAWAENDANYRAFHVLEAVHFYHEFLRLCMEYLICYLIHTEFSKCLVHSFYKINKNCMTFSNWYRFWAYNINFFLKSMLGTSNKWHLRNIMTIPILGSFIWSQGLDKLWLWRFSWYRNNRKQC